MGKKNNSMMAGGKRMLKEGVDAVMETSEEIGEAMKDAARSAGKAMKK